MDARSQKSEMTRAAIVGAALVADIYALMLGLIHDTRFLRDPRAAERAQASWQRLVHSYQP